MTTFGANIWCATCGARPWPEDSTVRATFDLRRVNGEWRCEKHRASPKEKRVRTPRNLSASPHVEAALDDFESVLTAQSADLAGTIEFIAEDPEEDEWLPAVTAALENFKEELTHQFGALKRALAS